MKRLISALALCALAACGGGSSTVTPPPKPVSAAAVGGTMSFVVTIPLPGTVIPQSVTASSTTRMPQYLAPQTSFILVDLQGGNANPAFDNTFLISPATCQVGGGTETCTFTMPIPAGDPTTQLWSIVAGSGKPDGTGTMLSVAHNVPPCSPFPCQSTPTITVYLNPVVANVQTQVLNWTANQFPRSRHRCRCFRW